MPDDSISIRLNFKSESRILERKKVIMGIPNNDNLMSGQLERGRIPSEDPVRIIQEPPSESTDSPYKVLWHVCLSGRYVFKTL